MKKISVTCILALFISTGAFAANFTLTVTIAPPDSGSVTLDPSAGPYPAGSQVRLMPVAMPGFRFDRWEGSLAGNKAPESITMSGNKRVTAVFTPIAITFTLDDHWQAIAQEPTGKGYYTVTGPKLADLGYGAHVLTVSATDDQCQVDSVTVLAPQEGVVITVDNASADLPVVLTATAHTTAGRVCADPTVQDSAMFILVAADADMDADRNGIPDNSFEVLNAAGTAWTSSVIVPDTRGRRLTAAVRWDAPDGDAESDKPLVLSLKDPARPSQTVTVSAPRNLLKEITVGTEQLTETGILIVQTASDLPTLFGSLEASLLGNEPSVLADLGRYVEVTVLVSLDGGDSYSELDSERFDDHPLHLFMNGLTSVIAKDDALVYSHQTGFARNNLTGDQIVAWDDAWSTDSVRNVFVGNHSVEADLVRLSVLAPYEVPLDGPVIALSPPDGYTYAYGWAPVGSLSDTVITVRNVGGGTLTGTVLSSPEAAFTVVSGGVYNLDAGKSQKVTVRFKPTAVRAYQGNLTFAGGGGATLYLTGSGYVGAHLIGCFGGTAGGQHRASDALADGTLFLAVMAALWFAGHAWTGKRRNA